MKLTIELVPKTCFYSNVRSEVTEAQWETIKREIYAQARNRCQICGGRGPQWPVECHEIWHYDDEKRVQTRTGMTALCPACHQVKHFGLAQMRGNGSEALQHLMDVNGWEYERAKMYVQSVFETWAERSRRQWVLDIGYLEFVFGIKPKEKVR